MRRVHQHVCCALLALAPVHVTSAQSAAALAPWKLSGSYLNLYSQSRTVVPPAQGFTLDLNRLRLKLEGELIKGLSIELQDDQELLAGNYLRTPQFALVATRPPTTKFGLDHDYFARGDVVARHRVYRAIIAWTGASTDLKIGRQRIALGTGRFWSPLDLLNPIDPTRLERDYRPGADAVLVERRLGALARVQGVYAPATASLPSVTAGYVHGNTHGTDYSVLVGRVRGDDAIGGDFSTARGGLGIRGEATWTRSALGPRYGRALLGVDYGFANTLTLTGELYYNGQGVSDAARYDLGALLAGRVINLARRYGAIAASYELTPLLTVAGYGVLNADDRSGVLWPRLEYSAAANVDIAVGVQRFVGGADSEYGRLSNLLHAEVRWFF